jgi:hypothetical protein
MQEESLALRGGELLGSLVGCDGSYEVRVFGKG